MDLPNETNNENVTKRLFVLLGILIFVGLIVSAIFLWRQNVSKNRLLVSVISPGEAIQTIYSTPSESIASYPTSRLPPESEGPFVPPKTLELTKEVGILAVSTGEISSTVLKNSEGEKLAKATTLKVLTLDNDGKIETLNIVLQIFPANDPGKNVIPWFIERAANIRSLTITFNSSSMLLKEQIAEIFPNGSLWVFKPLVDLDSVFLSPDLKKGYIPLARQYYGNHLPSLTSYLDSGLKTNYKRQLLLIGINPYTGTRHLQ